jgi:hypothetical protein
LHKKLKIPKIVILTLTTVFTLFSDGTLLAATTNGDPKSQVTILRVRISA